MSTTNGRDLEIKIEWDNAGGETSKRFYKGWYLNEVFDYTLTSSTGNTTTTCYAKFSEDKDWYSYTQKSGTGHNEGWNWSFSAKNGLGHQTLSKNTFETSGMTGVIHHYNAGFLLHGTSTSGANSDLATQIWAGADENYSSSYVGETTWSKVRVYARKLNSGHDIYSSTYSLTPSQPTSLFDICGSFIDRREIIPTKANVSKTVAQLQPQLPTI